MFKRIATLALFLLAVSSLWAQPRDGFGSISGTVTYQNGSAAAGVDVLVDGGDPMHPLRLTVTDEGGNYSFDSVLVGMRHVQAIAQGYLPVMGQGHVTQNQNTDIDLTFGNALDDVGMVSGTVTFENGEVAMGAMVILERDGWPPFHREFVTRPDGSFTFTNIPEGEYEIEARMWGHEEAEAEVTVVADENTVVNLVLGGGNGGGEGHGIVTGLVLLGDGGPAVGARVRLDGGRDPMHGHHRETIADAAGAFNFQNVGSGGYFINASLPQQGFASEVIEVTDNQTTNVTLTLARPDSNGHGGGGGGHGGGHGDSLTIVELSGTAMVEAGDSAEHRPARFFLDTDGDGTADYRLAFGPPWYNPDNGNQRPNNGDQITVRGGLFSYGEPPMVIVYDLNGMFWREPRRGHGGHGGGHHGPCNPDSVTRVELEGIAVVNAHGDRTFYAINTEGDQAPEYGLDFGRPDYDPGNGATRPAAGDTISIVGGLVWCPDNDRQWVIVYEINGLYWRQPGDTLGLAYPDGATSVEEPEYVGVAQTYLMANNYPNPFNPTTTISYSVPMAGNVKVAVYNIVGQEIATLVSGFQNAGTYNVAWDAGSQGIASGLYLYKITVGEMSLTKRMVLMK